jgi:hypothetical protein
MAHRDFVIRCGVVARFVVFEPAGIRKVEVSSAYASWPFTAVCLHGLLGDVQRYPDFDLGSEMDATCWLAERCAWHAHCVIDFVCCGFWSRSNIHLDRKMTPNQTRQRARLRRVAGESCSGVAGSLIFGRCWA